MKQLQRLAAVLAIALLALSACQKKQDETAQQTIRTAQTQIAGKRGAITTYGPNEKITPEKIKPVFNTAAVNLNVANGISVDFNFPMVKRNRVGRKPDKDTEIILTPETKGAWTWETNRRLSFQPKTQFLFRTGYTVRIKQVESKDGAMAPADSVPWHHTFETPAFAVRSLELESVSFGRGYRNRRNKQFSILATFSGPVKSADVWKNRGLTINDAVVNAMPGTYQVKTNQVRFTYSNVSFAHNSVAKITITSGLASQDGKASLKESFDREFTLQEQRDINIQNVQVKEGESGMYIEVTAREKSAQNRGRYYNSSYYDRNATFESDLVTKHVEVYPDAGIKIRPFSRGFKIRGNFKQGNYRVVINSGLLSKTGAVLTKTHESEVRVPLMASKVTFLSKGRFLPRKYIGSLPVSHINTDKITVSIRHIFKKNINFWLSGGNEYANNRNSDLVESRVLDVTNVENRKLTSWLNLKDMLPDDTKGVFEIKVTEPRTHKSDYARLILTDLALVVKRAGNDIQVWALDVNTLKPAARTRVGIYSHSNRELAAKQTGGDGFCEFKNLVPPKNAQGPWSVIAEKDDNVIAFRLENLKVSTGHFEVGGKPFSSTEKYRAAIYSDCGVYRPGQTAHITAVVREENNLAPAEPLPLIGRVYDPQMKSYVILNQETNPAGMATFAPAFHAFASTGKYKFVLETGGQRIETYFFNVEEFVPERMKVTVTLPEEKLLRTDTVKVDVLAKYLFGAPAAEEKVELNLTISEGTFTPAKNTSYSYGVWRKDPFKPSPLPVMNGVLDKEGTISFKASQLEAAGLTGPARLTAQASVFEAGSGRSTVNSAAIVLHPEKKYVGLKSSVDRISQSGPVTIEGIVVDLEGNAVTGTEEVEFTLSEIQSEWVYEYDDTRHRYRYNRYEHESEITTTVIKTGKGRFSHTFTAPDRAEGYVVTARLGEHVESSLKIEGNVSYHYYYSQETYDQGTTPRPIEPEQVHLETPDHLVVGTAGEIKVFPPFKGKLFFSLETDRVIQTRWLEVDEEPVTIPVTLDEFYPNVYVSVMLLKDGNGADNSFVPGSGFAAKSIRVKPEQFTLDLDVEVPDVSRSEQELAVTLKTGKRKEKAYATVSLVDEGILQLTKFKSPRPLRDLFKPRALGVSTHETMGWTFKIPPQTESSPGGDAGSGAEARIMPVKPVVLWSGIVEIPASGTKKLTFDIPQYQGQLRVMAVMADKKRVGSSARKVTVRDPIILQSTFPRFLQTRDRFEIPVAVINMTGKPGTFTVTFDGNELIALQSKAVQTLNLGKDQTGSVLYKGAVRNRMGGVAFTVTASGNQASSRNDATIPVMPNGPEITEKHVIKLKNGKNALMPYLEGWEPSYEKTAIWVTANQYMKEMSHLKYLIRYPYGCIEQTTSSTRPLLYIGDLVLNLEKEDEQDFDIDKKFMHGINRLFSMQTSSGGFSYWPGQTAPTYWGTAYATHVMLMGIRAEYPISKERVDDALRFMETALNGDLSYRDAKYGYSVAKSEPYMQYVLALAGKARKGRIKQLIDNPPSSWEELKEENLFLLKAALYTAGDRTYEKDLKAPDYLGQNRRTNGWSFWTVLRSQGMMLDVAEELFSGDAGAEPLAQHISGELQKGNSRGFTTQELSWCVSALGRRVSGAAKGWSKPVLTRNGKTVKPQDTEDPRKTGAIWNIIGASGSKNLVLDVNLKKGNLYALVTVKGIKPGSSEYKNESHKLRVSRKYLTQKGAEVDFSDVKLGDLVFVELGVQNLTGSEVKNIALVDRFPAGLEIENPRLAREYQANWMDTRSVWQHDYLDMKDYCIQVFGQLPANNTIKVYYVARAVTRGTFSVPPVRVEAMYDPEVWSLQTGPGKLTVTD